MNVRLGIWVVAAAAAVVGVAALTFAGLGSSAVTTAGSGSIVYSEGPRPTWTQGLRLLNLATGAKQPLARKRFAHRASWSPDGMHIAVEDNGPRGRQTTQIGMFDLRSGSLHRLTHSDALDEFPAWSPNGRRIAFSRSPVAVRYTGIWLMNAGGGGERQLTHNRYGDYCARWSPDGRRIAFYRYHDRSNSRDLWLMRSDGKNQHRLLSGASCAAWSPDGSQLAISRQTGQKVTTCGCLVTDLYLGDTNGARRHLLVRNGGSPTWSPDGTRIAFARWQGGRTHLWLINADGTGLRQLTRGSNSQAAPAWRPGS